MTREVEAEAPPIARGRGLGLQPDDAELDAGFRRNRARMGISGEPDEASLARLLQQERTGREGGLETARPRHPRRGIHGLGNPDVVPDSGSLARRLQRLRNGDGEGPPIILPGQFVPELGGFVDRPIYDVGEVKRRAGATPDFNPAARSTRIGMQRPTSVDVPDERFRRLTGSEGEAGFFLDESRTPESQARTQAAEQRSMLAQALEGLRRGDVTGDDLALALEGGIPGSTIDDFLLPEEHEGPTAEELRAAGVPEQMIPLAMRDPAVARAFALDTLEDDEPRRGFTAEELRAAGVREDLIPAGVRDPVLGRSLIRDANRTGTPEGDEAFEERRDAMVAKFGEPVTAVRQAAVAELAAGKTKEQILRDMRALNFPPEKIQEVDDYLKDVHLRSLGLPVPPRGGAR